MYLAQTQHYPQTFLSILESLWIAMYYHICVLLANTQKLVLWKPHCWFCMGILCF